PSAATGQPPRTRGRDRPLAKRAPPRDRHLPRRTAGRLAVGRQWRRTFGLRTVGSRRFADRPRPDPRPRLRGAVPGGAPGRDAGRDLDGPPRVDHLRRAGGLAVGRPGPLRREVRLPRLRLRGPVRRTPLEPPLGDTTPGDPW